MKKKPVSRRLSGAMICFLTAFLVTAGPASLRAEEYAPPTFSNIVKALVRFGALDISDDNNLNGYAMVVECKLYKRYFDNDFKWHQIQAAMRKAIRQDVSSFPTALYYDATLKLDRYNFKNKVYQFTDKSSLANVDYFTLLARLDDACVISETNRVLPEEYQFVLDQPLVLAGIPLSEEDGQTLLTRMDGSNNKSHLVFARFNMRIVFISRLTRPLDQNNRPAKMLRQDAGKNFVRLDARMGSIDFYEDEARTKLIYSYRP
ncbi:MAG: DUF4852 domain-containing protein [Alphaproteobacteria bacterium]|nr:DUF4852 domain-containing protein [Alphaproteobacteria bacterium]